VLLFIEFQKRIAGKVIYYGEAVYEKMEDVKLGIFL
jgi:hypothetical protein